MLNKAIVMGRLTRDPELRYTQSGTAVCSFAVAVERDRKDASGQRGVDFVDCVAWGNQADFVKRWFAKGQMAVIVGRIQSRRWADQNGTNRVAIEVNCEQILFGETKKAREGAAQATIPTDEDGVMPYDYNDEDVPF